MLIGYARVSTPDQNVDHQLDALTRAGVEEANLYVDVFTGSKDSRPKWDIVQQVIRSGDVLVATRLDRFGRSLVHLVNLAYDYRERDIGLRVLEQAIDTTTAEGRLMFGVLCLLAEYQRELIIANTLDGLAAARSRGRVGGRPRRLTPAQARHLGDLKRAGNSVTEIAGLTGIPRATVYGYLSRAGIDA